ncbi:hypothetical protein ACFX2I_001242 [Malus domestica]
MKINKKQFPPEEISSMVMGKMREIAEVSGLSAQLVRLATKDADNTVGLNVIRSSKNQLPQPLLLHLTRRPVGIARETPPLKTLTLGGEDIDNIMVIYSVEEFTRKHGLASMETREQLRG